MADLFLGLSVTGSGATIYSIAQDGTWTQYLPTDASITSTSALAFDCKTQTAYSISGGFSTTAYTIDLNTGIFSTLPGTTGGLANDMTYDSINDTLYGSGVGGLYEVDKITGNWGSPIATAPGGGSLFSICYNCPNNRIYCVVDISSVRYLYDFDPVSQTFINPRTLSTNLVFQLGYDEINQELYGFNGSNSYIIDPTTGNVTLLGASGVTGMVGAVFAGSSCCVCVTGNTKVQMADSTTIPIRDVKAGDIVVNHQGKKTKVLMNVNSGKQKEFIRIEKGAFAPNSPSRKLLIRKGHPILFGTQEVPCETLYDMGHRGVSEVTLERGKEVYTLVTDRKDFVLMNGLNVGTWSETDFEIMKETNDTSNFKYQ